MKYALWLLWTTLLVVIVICLMPFVMIDLFFEGGE